MKKFAIAAGLCLAAITDQAHAAVLTSSYDLSAYLSPAGSSPTPFTISQFDPALGTLEWVGLSLEVWSGGSMRYSCRSPCTQTYQNHTSGMASLIGVELSGVSEDQVTYTLGYVPSSGSFGFGGGYIYDNSGQLADPALLAQFSGAGSISGLASGRAYHGCSGTGSCDASESRHGLRLYVSYGYVEPLGVPEPAIWATMVGGFGTVGGAVRRRRRRRAVLA